MKKLRLEKKNAERSKKEYCLEKATLAAEQGLLLPESLENLRRFFASTDNAVDISAINELIDIGAWQEINNRFFKTLVFGTGGLRGRTLGLLIANAERGERAESECPEHPCVGFNAMNFFNVSLATQGLAVYLKKWFAGKYEHPKVCIAHDTRYFSRSFAEFTARILTELGCDVLLFENYRSTPELSFTIRYTGSQAGINITASHNPPPYNGYKVFFDDGGQVIGAHADGIIAAVNAITAERHQALPISEQGTLTIIGEELDRAYMDRLNTVLLRPELIREQHAFRVVYSPLHGTGAVIVKPLLKRLGFTVSVVAEQDRPDGGFPTVRSPNPEMHEALSMAIQQAEKESADLVIATDPDSDRLGVAVRDEKGKMQLLTGNQIGSLMLWYRLHTLFELGVVDTNNVANTCILKSVVTTELQKRIAEAFGVRCVETLTGFKYMAAKMRRYEQEIPEEWRKDYVKLSEQTTRDLRLKYSTYVIFAAEESYGYSGADFVHDKDANSAIVMFAEMAVYARSRNQTVRDLLDEIYKTYGYYAERGAFIVMEGAEGAKKIQELFKSYIINPPSSFNGYAVYSSQDFSKGDIRDSEGELLPKSNVLIFELENNYRIAIRPSGTEPKIKYYLGGSLRPRPGAQLSEHELATAKISVENQLSSLWKWIENDIAARLQEAR